MAGATNKSTVFSHGKDLLFALGREMKPGRPVIFVAHSLGGIVVKEMLAHSSASAEMELKNVVESTAAVIFLGTPHRGSLELAALGEWARGLVSALRMETNASILNALGLRTTDLERAQEAFSALWQKYDFRVKTFQEGLTWTGVNLGVLGSKVVPDYSSAIGDVREHAETIEANHMEMCRFAGIEDPNYRKVSGEIKSIYAAIVALATAAQQTAHQGSREQQHQQRRLPAAVPSQRGRIKVEDHALSDVEIAALKSLRFPNMDSRCQTTETPAANTCLWLFEHEAYQDWLSGRNRDKHRGLLWLRGKPGAGKSTLMKEAFRRASASNRQATPKCWVAAFFFNAKGGDLEHSPTGLFRSLLYQLLPRNYEHLRAFVATCWKQKDQSTEDNNAMAQPSIYRESELRTFFHSLFTARTTPRTIIFVDALDECDTAKIRSHAYFWREITKSAHVAGVDLNVCLSSRHFPSISVADCPQIDVDVHNGDDIATYIDARLDLGIANDDEAERCTLRERILRKSVGVFLWVVLVVDSVLGKRDQGRSMQSLLREIDAVPEALETLFYQILSTVEPNSRDMTLRLFHWVTLSTRPLRLREWHHILAFIGEKPSSSLLEWRTSDAFTETDEQLERQIRTISKGLIEVSSGRGEPLTSNVLDSASVRAGAGSLELDDGETRVVQVIHESVREFFLRGGGLPNPEPGHGTQATIANGHLSIMQTCLDYIKIKELDALVEARSLAVCRPPGTPNSSERSRGFLAIPSLRGRRNNSLDSIESLGSYETFGTIGSVQSFNSAGTHMPRGLRNRPAYTRQRPPSVFEKLRKWSDSAWGRDYFAQKMSMYQVEADQMSFIPLTRNSLSHSSRGPAGSQVLEAYPALLSYATLELFAHAELAEEAGADPRPIICRLREKDQWRRWVVLHEDLSHKTGLLYYAADRGLTSWVRCIGGFREDPGWSPEDSVTPAVMEAVARRNPDALGLLLDQFGCDGPYKDSRDRPLVHVLTRQHSVEMLKVFLLKLQRGERSSVTLPDGAHHPLLEELDAHKRTALHVAALRRNADIMSELLRHGADTYARDGVGRTALQIVCSNKQDGKSNPTKEGAICTPPEGPSYELARLLLLNGADVNFADKDGHTPLHVVCYNIPEECSSTEEGHNHHTAGRGATESAHVRVISLLLEHGADVNRADDIGATPLHLACRGNSLGTEQHANTLDVVKTLIQAGADPQAVSNVGETPLHVAAARCNVEVVAELIRHGARVMARDALGQIPLHHVAWACNDAAAELLLSQDEQAVDAADNNKSTALHFACQFFPSNPEWQPASLALIRRLLDRGARGFDNKNWLGLSPYDIAKSRSLTDVVELLRETAVDRPVGDRLDTEAPAEAPEPAPKPAPKRAVSNYIISKLLGSF
jgi:ankyrin repeat protein